MTRNIYRYKGKRQRETERQEDSEKRERTITRLRGSTAEYDGPSGARRPQSHKSRNRQLHIAARCRGERSQAGRWFLGASINHSQHERDTFARAAATGGLRVPEEDETMARGPVCTTDQGRFPWTGRANGRRHEPWGTGFTIKDHMGTSRSQFVGGPRAVCIVSRRWGVLRDRFPRDMRLRLLLSIAVLQTLHLFARNLSGYRGTLGDKYFVGKRE